MSTDAMNMPIQRMLAKVFELEIARLVLIWR
jgi:hypothetical protein